MPAVAACTQRARVQNRKTEKPYHGWFTAASTCGRSVKTWKIEPLCSLLSTRQMLARTEKFLVQSQKGLGGSRGLAHYLFGFFRNSSRVGPSRPSGSSGTMKRFPAKVKGSRLDAGERRHGHRGRLDSPVAHCSSGVRMEVETHISSQAGAGGHGSKAPLPGLAARARGCPTSTGKERLQPLGSPHRSLTISFLELFIRT